MFIEYQLIPAFLWLSLCVLTPTPPPAGSIVLPSTGPNIKNFLLQLSVEHSGIQRSHTLNLGGEVVIKALVSIKNLQNCNFDKYSYLQYFGHLMQRADSLEKTLMLGKIEGKRRRG